MLSPHPIQHHSDLLRHLQIVVNTYYAEEAIKYAETPVKTGHVFESLKALSDWIYP